MEKEQKMSLYSLEKELIEELDGLKEELRNDNDPRETITDVVDSLIPVYTYDSLTVAESNLWIATEKAEWGETPLDQINCNIFTHLEEKAGEWAEANEIEL